MGEKGLFIKHGGEEAPPENIEEKGLFKKHGGEEALLKNGGEKALPEIRRGVASF